MVNRSVMALYRLSLRAYPSSFRRDYETALVQHVVDRCRFGNEATVRVMARELADVGLTATRMRGESPMTRFVFAVAAVAASIVGALIGGPLAVAAAAVVGLAVFVGMRRSGLTMEEAVPRRHPSRWLVASGLAVAAGIAIPSIQGGELSEPWWFAMAVLIVAGVVLGVTGIGLAISDDHSPATPPPA